MPKFHLKRLTISQEQTDKFNLAVKLKANCLIQLTPEQIVEILSDKTDGFILPLTQFQLNELSVEPTKSYKAILNRVQLKELTDLNGLPSFEIDYLAFKHGK